MKHQGTKTGRHEAIKASFLCFNNEKTQIETLPNFKLF